MTTWFDDALRIVEERRGPAGAERIRALGMPGIKTEGWQHAGLREFFATPRHVLADAATVQPSCALPGQGLIFWNGRYVPSELPAGVSITAASPEAPLTAFAGFADFLAPAVTLTITQPVTCRLISYVEGMLPSVMLQSIAIVAEADATIILENRTLGENPGHLLCQSFHVHVRNGTLTLTDTPNDVSGFYSMKATVDAYASLQRQILPAARGLRRDDMEVRLAEHASTNLTGLYLQQEGVSSLRSRVMHEGPHAASSQMFRSSVFGGARVAVDVETHVTHAAADTDAFQESRHLLLASEARAFTIPRLRIDTDDVRCKHGATVGHADKEQLAYMRARGIGDQRARSLLAFGHLHALLENFPASEREAISASLRTHLLLA